MAKPMRKHPRLSQYDYAAAGAYHITVCTKKKAQLLSVIVGRADPCAPQVELTPLGQVVDSYIQTISDTYPTVLVDHYVIMPNHIHLLLRIDAHGAQGSARPTVSSVVRALKVMVRKTTGSSPFQPSFHDHIIRCQEDYDETWQYIENNPLKWSLGRKEIL